MVIFGWMMSVVLVTSTLYISVSIQTSERTTVSTEKMLVSSVSVSKVDTAGQSYCGITLSSLLCDSHVHGIFPNDMQLCAMMEMPSYSNIKQNYMYCVFVDWEVPYFHTLFLS